MGCCRSKRDYLRQKSLEVALLEDHGFTYSGRKFKDLFWLVLYAVFMIWIVAGGIVALENKNPDYQKLAKGQQVDACAKNTPPLELQSTYLQTQFENLVNMKELEKIGYEVLAITAAGALLLGAAFLWCFSFCPCFMVSLTVVCIFIIPAGVGAYALFAQGKAILTVSLPLIIAAVIVLIFLCCLMSVFPLVIKLLDKASDCLIEQPGMILASLLLLAGGLGLLYPMLLFVLSSMEVGQANLTSDDVCQFQQATWAQVLFWTGIVAMVWTILLVMQIKTYFIAGSAAQWYFNNEDPPAWNPTLLSFKWALSTSLGSLCVSSLLLTFLTGIRALAEYIRRENPKNCLLRCLCCCVNCIISCIAFMTRFATIYIAITGESFYKGARGAVEILQRNALNAFGVWWLPDFILYSASILLAAAWGLLAKLIYGQYVKDGLSATEHEDVALRVGYLAGAEALVILLFFDFVLLNVVDAMYVTMAIDKDADRVKRSDVHEVFHSLPTMKKGVVVQDQEQGEEAPIHQTTQVDGPII